jgi:hypothetical protein
MTAEFVYWVVLRVPNICSVSPSTYTVKKVCDFSGMSLTKLSLAGNNLELTLFPSQGLWIWPLDTCGYKVHIYVPRVPQCFSPRPNRDSPTPSPASECAPSPNKKRGGTHSPACKGVGESQFGRLEKKLSTLPTVPKRRCSRNFQFSYEGLLFLSKTTPTTAHLQCYKHK